MERYAFRLLNFILASSIATTPICLVSCRKPSYRDPGIHSSQRNSPYSVLEGRTIRLKPYDATFVIPQDWLIPKPIPGEPAKNLYLSWEDLNYLSRNDGDDAEEAQVINSVLSFADCAAHMGDQAWGNSRWNDLQGRVYVTELTIEEIVARVESQGLAEASSVFEHASILSGNHEAWQSRIIDIVDAPEYSDFTLGKRLDFYYRSFGNKRVVFIFLHAGGFDETINGILDSFRWSR
jgi:hypothetical protein